MALTKIWVLDPWSNDTPRSIADAVMDAIQQGYEMNNDSFHRWYWDEEFDWDDDDVRQPNYSLDLIENYLLSHGLTDNDEVIILVHW